MVTDGISQFLLGVTRLSRASCGSPVICASNPLVGTEPAAKVSSQCSPGRPAAESVLIVARNVYGDNRRHSSRLGSTFLACGVAGSARRPKRESRFMGIGASVSDSGQCRARVKQKIAISDRISSLIDFNRLNKENILQPVGAVKCELSLGLRCATFPAEAALMTCAPPVPVVLCATAASDCQLAASLQSPREPTAPPATPSL